MDYTISRSERGTTVMVEHDGEVMVFGPDHPMVEQAADAVAEAERTHDGLIAGPDRLVEALGAIHAPAVAINDRLRAVSDRFSYVDGCLRFDGDVIDKTLTRTILDRLRAGDESWQAYARFMERLAQNPSAASKRALYRFIGDRDLTIAEDGYVVGFKGVRADGRSVHSGFGIVHRLHHGAAEASHYEDARLPNEPGTWVEFPRAAVDPDPEAHCSVGLHVGSREYAESFGERLLTVLVDPAAVVMVPADADGQKMRVWQYYVTDIEPVRTDGMLTINASVAFEPDGIAATDVEDETCEDEEVLGL